MFDAWSLKSSTTLREIRRSGPVGVGVALLEWVWPCWSECGLVEVGMALLGEVCHRWVDLRVSKA